MRDIQPVREIERLASQRSDHPVSHRFRRSVSYSQNKKTGVHVVSSAGCWYLEHVVTTSLKTTTTSVDTIDNTLIFDKAGVQYTPPLPTRKSTVSCVQ